MRVRLSNEYYIEQIPYNYVLRQSTVSYGSGDKVSEKPKLVEKDCGYYGSFGHAVKGYLKTVINEKTQDFDGDMAEYVRRVENIVNGAVEEIKRLNKW